MSILQTLKNFFFRDEHNEDYICANCPAQNMSIQDFNKYKNKEKIRSYCQKHYGNNVNVTQYFTNNKLTCIRRDTD